MDYNKINELGAVMKGLQVDKKVNFSIFKAPEELNKIENKGQVRILGNKMIKALAVEKDIKKLEHIMCIKQDLSKKYKDYRIQNGDIVIPVFPSKEQLDIIYIENVEAENCAYNDSNLIIRVVSNKITPKYLYTILNSKTIKDKILKLCSKNTRQARITATILEDLDIPILSIEQQEEIIKSYTNAINQLKQVENDIKKMVKGGMPYGTK